MITRRTWLTLSPLKDGRNTGLQFHAYRNPERAVDPALVEVRGLASAFLADKPKFAEVAENLMYLLGRADLVAHNAVSHVGFLNAEQALASLPSIDLFCPSVIDTLHLAKDTFPGQRNSLAALCERLRVDIAPLASNPWAVIHAVALARVNRQMAKAQ